MLVLGLGAAGGALAQRLYRAAPDEEALESDEEGDQEALDDGTSTAADLLSPRAPSRQPAGQAGQGQHDFFHKPDPRPPATNTPAPTTPRPKPGRRGGSGSGVTGAVDVDQFGAQLASSLCEKLAACGLFDPSLGLGGAGGALGGAGLCDLAASALQDPEAAERVRRGECEYDSTAASKCLDALDGLSCDSMDPDGLLALADSMDSCATAFRCD